ncbi:hypothetical protein BRADI_2g59816v3 [Brachypodium distachyon]|uniref:Uncharacterized protein n=1 Tax=Brachypodium distachyon TaxID=15368 RepID=A0A2K2DGX3_BRADI|nr:hypothetical protein BRADI_2g59816v3 [Brachypodium distachyon]
MWMQNERKTERIRGRSARFTTLWLSILSAFYLGFVSSAPGFCVSGQRSEEYGERASAFVRGAACAVFLGRRRRRWSSTLRAPDVHVCGGQPEKREKEAEIYETATETERQRRQAPVRA